MIEKVNGGLVNIGIDADQVTTARACNLQQTRRKR